MRGESSKGDQFQAVLRGTAASSDTNDQAFGMASRFGVAEVEPDVESAYSDQFPVSRVVTGFSSAIGHTEELFQVDNESAYSVPKRILDVCFSSFVIALCWPAFLAIAIAIKLSSPGPVLFIQERVGLNGKAFKMLKFRSMYVNDRCDTHHTMVGDPRITRVGNLLRRTSLDELPQFINVLKGDMSVVGPRPELTHFVGKFQREIPWYMDRHRAKGGITGWAQINGFRGSETSIAERVQYDLEYLHRWSLALDLQIILVTIYKGFINNAF